MNNGDTIFSPGTKLNLSISLEAHKIGKNLRLRMEVSYRDGTMAATAFTQDLTQRIVLGHNVLKMVFDTAG
jgi:hypothetical protein